MTQDATALCGIDSDTAKVGAADVFNGVVFGETIIEEGVIGVDEIEDTAILLDDLAEE